MIFFVFIFFIFWILSTGANNLIPMEIALKIANKIRANERFSAYILIPMWPEGVPTSTPVQRILFWQVGCFLQKMFVNWDSRNTLYQNFRTTTKKSSESYHICYNQFPVSCHKLIISVAWLRRIVICFWEIHGLASSNSLSCSQASCLGQK